MKSQDIEGRVSKAFSSIKPDNFESIVSDIEPHSREIIDFGAEAERRPPYRKILRTAAILLLCFTFLGGIGQYSSAHAVYSTVNLDTDSAIELKLNRKNEPVSVSCKGDDAGMDESFKGLSLEETVDMLMTAELERNGISSNENSVLLSVESRSPERAGELESRLAEALQASLSSKGLSASVISQTLEGASQDAGTEPELSPGKLSLISRIKAAGAELSTEALAEMSINELNLLISCGGLSPEGVEIRGKASTSLYLDENSAKLAAETDFGLSEDEISSSCIQLGFEDNKAVYYVNLDSGIFSYSCVMDALSGSIGERSQEYTEDFRHWYSEQSENVQSWVDENSLSLRKFADEIGRDCRNYTEDCILGIENLTEDIAGTVLSIFEQFIY